MEQKRDRNCVAAKARQAMLYCDCPSCNIARRANWSTARFFSPMSPCLSSLQPQDYGSGRTKWSGARRPQDIENSETFYGARKIEEMNAPRSCFGKLGWQDGRDGLAAGKGYPLKLYSKCVINGERVLLQQVGRADKLHHGLGVTASLGCSPLLPSSL